MLSQLSSIQAMVNGPEILPAELNVETVDNATLTDRTALSNEDHVTATEKGLDDITQTRPDHINARGQDVHVGSDVGGYVYLVLTRISGTVSDELSSLKASFQLETATRRSVIAQADENSRKLASLIKDAKVNN